MLQLKSPGIYTREVPSGVRTVTAAATSVALFLGPTKSGIDGRAQRIFSYADYDRLFGGLSQSSSLSYSVLHFFANGGGEAFVIRVPASGATAATSTIKRDLAAGSDGLILGGLSSGAASNRLFLEFDDFGIGAKPFAAGSDKKRFNMTVIDGASGAAERFGDISTSSSSARFLRSVVNDEATGSKLVSAAFAANALDKEGPQPNGSIYKVGTPPTAGAFAADVKVAVSVAVMKANGDPNNAASFNLEVTVFRGSATAPRPTSMLEVVTALANAVNEAIRADEPTRDKMGGASIEVAAFSEGPTSPPIAHLRIRTSLPPATEIDRRVGDATVKLADPAAGTSFLTVYGLTEEVANPARYQLGAAYPNTAQISAATPGSEGDVTGQPDSTAFKDAVTALDARDPFFNILCLPDLVRPAPDDPQKAQHANAMTVYAEAARVCQRKYAFLLVDPTPDITSVGAAEAWKSLRFFSSSHAAAYFPNIRVDDPLFPGTIRSHPPSGAIAGVYARIDGQFGPWRAPAGTDATLAGVYGPSIELSDGDQGVLNPIGLNCIRRFPIYQTISFGSRTTDGADVRASDWKYIPPRRTANLILLSLVENLRWAVHAPNGEELWSQLRLSVTAFMHGLFKRGAFKGVSSREAYFVLCDASTTTSADINQGIVNIVVGFAPLKPAEFVVISLRQIVQPTV